MLTIVVVRLLCLIAGLKSCSLRFQTADLRHHRAQDRCLENNRKLQLLVHFSHKYVRQKKPDKWTETCKPGFSESPILHQVISYSINTSYQGSNRTQAKVQRGVTLS